MTKVEIAANENKLVQQSNQKKKKSVNTNLNF